MVWGLLVSELSTRARLIQLHSVGRLAVMQVLAVTREKVPIQCRQRTGSRFKTRDMVLAFRRQRRSKPAGTGRGGGRKSAIEPLWPTEIQYGQCETRHYSRPSELRILSLPMTCMRRRVLVGAAEVVAVPPRSCLGARR